MSDQLKHAIEMINERLVDCHKSLDHDLNQIRDNKNNGFDPVLADMDIEAARARHILDTYELRRRRWILQKEFAAQLKYRDSNLCGIVRINTP